MFERYTEKTRRAIFFARYEASQFGSPYIETEHLLLGVLREDRALTYRFLHGKSMENIRKEIERHSLPGKRTSTSVDLPLSNECKRALAYAAEEAEVQSDPNISPHHLFLGLLRESASFAAALLRDCGVRLDVVRLQLKNWPQEKSGSTSAARSLNPASLENLTGQASAGLLQTLIGRQNEMERLIQVLGRANKRNPVLMGPFGAGRKTIVGGLAQRIVEGNVPEFLGDRKIVAIEPGSLLRSVMQGPQASSDPAIYFVEEFFRFLLDPPKRLQTDPAEVFKGLLLEGKLQLITLATPEEARDAFARASWLERCFTAIDVTECSQQEALEVLRSLQKRLEGFHEVTFAAEAVEAALLYSIHFLRDRVLPDKAIDLLDEAGAYKRAHPDPVLPEVTEARQRIHIAARKVENAVANHEFEKARFYSDEERKERRGLEEIYRKNNIDPSQIPVVTRDTVEHALATWIGVSLETIRKAAETRPESNES